MKINHERKSILIVDNNDKYYYDNEILFDETLFDWIYSQAKLLEYYRERNDDLQERINKAIEFIKNIENDGEYEGYLSMLVEDRDELLSILEGDDKE